MRKVPQMKSQDIVILLKIAGLSQLEWQQLHLANSLRLSQGEISQSLNRSKYAGLIDESGKKVMRLALVEFLRYGLQYVFPQRPGAVVRGIPTAHSALPLSNIIQSNEKYVWPSALGTVRGQSINPLYPSVVYAIESDAKFYQLMALTDALRVGRAREKDIAFNEIKSRILDGE